MENLVKEFIDRKDERKNSANAKLKLLIYGVQDNPEIFKKFQKRGWQNSENMIYYIHERWSDEFKNLCVWGEVCKI